MQLKTFTRWWAANLSETGDETFDLLDVIRRGVAPFALIDALEKVEQGTHRPAHPTPKNHFDELENLQQFMDLLKERNLLTVNADPNVLHEGNLKIILGQTWKLILRYDVGHGRRSDAADGTAGLASLLAWLRGVCSEPPYSIALPTRSDELVVELATGRAFAAVLHSAHPELLDFASADALPAEARLKLVFDKALHLGVPRLLDHEDLGMPRHQPTP
jgi:hypothetical protein